MSAEHPEPGSAEYDRIMAALVKAEPAWTKDGFGLRSPQPEFIAKTSVADADGGFGNFQVRNSRNEPEKGKQGIPGLPITIVIGSVTTGTPSSVTVSGGPFVFTLDFVLEQGDKGDKGDKGDTGDKGDKGDPGTPGLGTGTTTITYRDCDGNCIGPVTVVIP